MKKEEWEAGIKETYDNLSRDQFNQLLDNCVKMVYIKSNNDSRSEGFDKLRKDEIKLSHSEFTENLETIEFENELDNLGHSVFLSVRQSRRMSFKQFKILSAFSKTHWLSLEPTNEYKQF